MADEVVQNNDVNLSDIIKEQSKTIDTLVSKMQESLDNGDTTSGQQIQPIYQTTPQETAKKPNYVLYIGIGIAIWFLLRRRK